MTRPLTPSPTPSKTGPAMSPGMLVPGVVVACLGAIAVFLLAGAFADGEVRRREMPLRALLGDTDYEALVAGHGTAQHYLHRPPAPAWVRPFVELRDETGAPRRAPDFELPAADGSRWRMSDRRGKLVVLNFWTVTCPPCLEEMPSLIQLARTLQGRSDIELVTISVDPDWETVRRVVPAEAPLTVLLDPERAVVGDRFGSRLFPETWVIDRDGIIRVRVDGSRDWSSPIVMDAIEAYL